MLCPYLLMMLFNTDVVHFQNKDDAEQDLIRYKVLYPPFWCACGLFCAGMNAANILLCISVPCRQVDNRPDPESIQPTSQYPQSRPWWNHIGDCQVSTSLGVFCAAATAATSVCSYCWPGICCLGFRSSSPAGYSGNTPAPGSPKHAPASPRRDLTESARTTSSPQDNNQSASSAGCLDFLDFATPSAAGNAGISSSPNPAPPSASSPRQLPSPRHQHQYQHAPSSVAAAKDSLRDLVSFDNTTVAIFVDIECL